MSNVDELIEVYPVVVIDEDSKRLELVPSGGNIGDIKSCRELRRVTVYVNNTFTYPGSSPQSTRNQISRHSPPEANAFSMGVRLREAGIKGKRDLVYYMVELKDNNSELN